MKSRTITAIVVTVSALFTIYAFVRTSHAQEGAPQYSPDGDTVAGFLQYSAQNPNITTYILTATTSTTITEYTLPISPLNVLGVQSGDIWFSSFGGNAIGTLDTIAGNVRTYSRQGSGNVWGLKQDAQGNIWYTTVNTDTVGKFNPATNTFTEWKIPSTHFGLEINPATGDVWFATRGTAPGIYKLSPATNSVVGWFTSPYIGTYDLDIDSNCNVWFTVQPGSDQIVGRLNPSNDQITAWTVPISQSRPFRILAETPDSIWFSEFYTATNSIAHLVPSTNILSEFLVPTSNSSPSSLLRNNGYTWFTENTGNNVGQLDPASGAVTTTILSPNAFTAVKTTSNVVPISYTVTVSTTPISAISTVITPTLTGGFQEFTLPTANSGPFGMDLALGGLWFAEIGANRIGRLPISSTVSPFTNRIYLPLVHGFSQCP